MKVYHLTGKQRLAVLDEPLPVPGPRDVLVKTRVSALSAGTEVWRYANHGHYGGEGGLCGYNSMGEVVETGTEVTRLRPGDLVFATHHHAEYLLVPEDRAVKLAADIDPEAAAFTYLPTLGLHALRAADYRAGENVLVVGLGIVGLLAAQVARLVGARTAALEKTPARRAWAARLAIGPVLDPDDPTTAVLLEGYYGESGPDVILETSQAWGGLMTAVRLARQGTRVAFVGIYRTDPPPELARELLHLTLMNRDLFHNQQLRFIGCSNDPVQEYPPSVARWTMRRNMEYVAEKIGHGELDTCQAITHRFRWTDLEQVYRRLLAGDYSIVGAVLHWD